MIASVLILYRQKMHPEKEFKMAEHTLPGGGKKRPNRLIHEKSPYLLQHAYNPVNWYPWGEEAFEKARKENKPVFLSIGYSTCHWCHVMEKESFEDPEVARVLNETFVCIKVDREERPDIDSTYMTVCQMLTGSGGWPLTIVMTPEKKPFFAGTYFPKTGRFGRVGVVELAQKIQELWKTRHSDILTQADRITDFLRESAGNKAGGDLGQSELQSAYHQLAERFESRYGGFGNAPKFPTPHNLLFLLRYWKRTGNGQALTMVEKTLQAMRQGGIYDHVGFGFHRYSTDAQWLVPHFEKMLYDQAMLALAYIEAYQATHREEYAKTAREIFTYVLRDMTSPKGGFYSAEDADSEGEEGKFYLWTEDEIRQFLGKEADLVIRVYNVAREGNFVEAMAGHKTGSNILHLTRPLAAIAGDLKMTEKALGERLEAAREKLFAVRETRIHPHKDDKILTDWNGLMIAALAKGAQVLDEPRYRETAERAAGFILNRLRAPKGRLLHRYRDGEAGIPAHVDDYAFLIWGLIELYEATFQVSYLQAALDLNRDLLTHFWDDKKGGFYLTADDGEKLLVRQKEVYDGAVPSGNSVALWNLLRLGRITGDADLEEKAARIGRAFAGSVQQMPSAYTQLMVALDFAVGPSHEVVIAGSLEAEDTKAMLKALRRHYFPNKVVLFRPEEEMPEIAQLAEFTRSQVSLNGRATAYVCQSYRCERPTTDTKTMLEMLKGKSRE